MVSHAISAITHTPKKPKLRNRCVHSLLPESAVGPSRSSEFRRVFDCQSRQLDHPFRSGHSHVTRSAGTEAGSYTENGTQYPGPVYSEVSTPLAIDASEIFRSRFALKRGTSWPGITCGFWSRSKGASCPERRKLNRCTAPEGAALLPEILEPRRPAAAAAPLPVLPDLGGHSSPPSSRRITSFAADGGTFRQRQDHR